MMSKKIGRPVSNFGRTLTDVASAFAIAITDPWHEMCARVGIPTGNAGPSYKLRTVKRIVATTGTAGYGFACFAPVTANDVATVAYSGSTYAGTVFRTTTATAGVSVTSMNKLPFTSAQVTDQTQTNAVSARVVSYGWKITYTGTEQNKGGVYYTVNMPDRSPIDGLGVADIGDYPQTRVLAIDRQTEDGTLHPVNWHEWSYSNSDTQDTDQMIYPYSDGAAGSATAVPAIAGVLWNAVAGTTFEVQLVQLIEYIGRGAQPFLTPSSSDIQGFEDVIAAAGSADYDLVGSPAGTRLIQVFRRALKARGNSLSPRVQAMVQGTAYGMRVGARMIGLDKSMKAFRNGGGLLANVAAVPFI